VACGGSGQRIPQLHQLQAVPDGDVGDHAALGRDDQGDLVECQPAPAIAERVCGTDRRSEPFHVADAGQFLSQRAGGGAGQQPVQRRPDHIGVNELAQPQAHVALAQP
jgi:hypothetical protein